MTDSERARLLELRKKGKVGRVPLTQEERAFVDAMWEKFPDEYGEVERAMQDWLHNAPWWELL